MWFVLWQWETSFQWQWNPVAGDENGNPDKSPIHEQWHAKVTTMVDHVTNASQMLCSYFGFALSDNKMTLKQNEIQRKVSNNSSHRACESERNASSFPMCCGESVGSEHSAVHGLETCIEPHSKDISIKRLSPFLGSTNEWQERQWGEKGGFLWTFALASSSVGTQTFFHESQVLDVGTGSCP